MRRRGEGIAAGALALAVVAVIALWPVSAAADSRSAAEAIVERFARDHQSGPKAPPTDDALRAPADEAEMLARAAAERIRKEAIQAQADRRAEEAERQAELEALSERIRRKRSAGVPASQGAAPPPEPAPDLARPEPAALPEFRVGSEAEPRPPAGTRATLLLAMEPGRTGIRRLNPTADPVLCLGPTCYIGQGPAADALPLPRRRALGAGNTLGARAGPCSGSLACVFRNVEFGSSEVVVEPIDLRLLRHDRRQAGIARLDGTCGLEGGRLHCKGGINGPDYRIWVVPERLAAEVGAPTLQASAAGLVRLSRRMSGSLPAP